MDQECGRLDAARNAIKASGITPGNRDVLFRAAHDIKGQAATFGFPQVAPVADSLCRLIEHMPDIARHAASPRRPACRRRPRHHAQEYARRRHRSTPPQLAEKLRHVTDEFLLHENRDRPDVLEAILSPSLVPNPERHVRKRGIQSATKR